MVDPNSEVSRLDEIAQISPYAWTQRVLGEVLVPGLPSTRIMIAPAPIKAATAVEIQVPMRRSPGSNVNSTRCEPASTTHPRKSP